MSYVFQATLIDTMRQYADFVAEEFLSGAGSNDEAKQREFLGCETDAELASDAICAWSLEDMDIAALMKAFSELRERLRA
jgi:hypothetical protein